MTNKLLIQYKLNIPVNYKLIDLSKKIFLFFISPRFSLELKVNKPHYPCRIIDVCQVSGQDHCIPPLQTINTDNNAYILIKHQVTPKQEVYI